MASKAKKKQPSPKEVALKSGIALHDANPLFGEFHRDDLIRLSDSREMGDSPAYVTYSENKYHGYGYSRHYGGQIYLNTNILLSPEEWAYTIAHLELHLAFGHFDAEKMPGYEKIGLEGTREWMVSCNFPLWNEACDIYIAKFLDGIKFGKATIRGSLASYTGSMADERAIYAHLLEKGAVPAFHFGVAAPYVMDMKGLEKPAVYDIAKNDHNRYTAQFALAMARSVTKVIGEAAGVAEGSGQESPAKLAAQWFINHYPLLGGLAAGFKIVESIDDCRRYDISIAAVEVSAAKIYVNPAAGLSDEELKFVLAHEYLHAGLQHHERRQGRDSYLWNIACDFVINGWLQEMHIGTMPERGELYDAQLKDKSAEEIYDRIVTDFRRFSKLDTFRGYGKSDIMGGDGNFGGTASLDDFYRSALQNGLEYHNEMGRGYIPAGLVEEIRALAMPPIPWDVELGRWFDAHFLPLAARRTYARPSRRQGSTPDIPRPRYIPAEIKDYARTFGVVVDTSGSMSAKLIGYALGAIASYADAKEVPYARVVFCDADAYDAGYLAPEDIAGRVAVKGRGGTVLQPGVNVLANAKNFPKDAPILIITDGYIESNLSIRREHAFLIPRGHHLPFRAKGKVFYFSEK